MSQIIYEDKVAIAIIPDKPSSTSHIRVLPKKKYSKLESMPIEEYVHLWQLASFCATSIFEIYQAHGTNIVCNNFDMTNSEKNVSIDIIGRYQNDGIDFSHTPMQTNDIELTKVMTTIKDKTFVMDHPVKKVEPQNLDKKETVISDKKIEEKKEVKPAETSQPTKSEKEKTEKKEEVKTEAKKTEEKPKQSPASPEKKEESKIEKKSEPKVTKDEKINYKLKHLDRLP